jgi:hypothetical protein
MNNVKKTGATQFRGHALGAKPPKVRTASLNGTCRAFSIGIAVRFGPLHSAMPMASSTASETNQAPDANAGQGTLRQSGESNRE